MFGLTFKLKLLQPLLVAGLDSGDANSARGLSHIPGSVIRGALTACYIAEHGLAYESDAVNAAVADVICRSLFFDDQVIFLNGLPEDRRGVRALPTPLSWHADKHALQDWNEDKSVHSLAVTDAIFADDALAEMDDAKVLAGEVAYCRRGDIESHRLEVERVQLRRESNVHIFRPHKRSNINTREETGLFSYEAIAADQIMCCAVATLTRDLASNLRDLLVSQLHIEIGRSRAAGYGRTQVFDVSEVIADWHESSSQFDEDVTVSLTQPDARGDEDTEAVVITLLSDVILRDRDGQYASAIGSTLGVRQNEDNSLAQPIRVFRRTAVVGGFNRKWGLPVPQAMAIQAGSVFAYRRADIDLAALQLACDLGIGERRADGYGRIAANLPCAQNVVIQKIEPSLQLGQTVFADQSIADRAAQQILEHRLRRMLDTKLREKVSDLKIVSAPSNALLSRLRQAARQSALAQSTEALSVLLADFKSHADSELRRAYLANMPFKDWLNARVNQCDIETQLQIEQIIAHIPALGNRRATMTDALQKEYTARLIEGVIHTATRRNQQTNTEERAR